MKKIALILALSLMWSMTANAVGSKPSDSEPSSSGDRDCIKYNASEAKVATQDDSSNTFSATFSHASARKGSTNADCAVSSGSSGSSGSQGNHSGGSN